MDKIDFVVPWVDGSDPNWIKKRNEYSTSPVSESRFRDWGFLKYWFRAVEEYAPWVNTIHFITEGHLPDFLNTNHPKLNIVRHEDFIPKEYLPTFSSHPIELNLHRIEGLSDYFVYFNDDVYLNKESKLDDFFKENFPRDCAIVNPIAPAFYGSVGNVMLNNISMINTMYDKRRVFKDNPFKWLNYNYGYLNLLNLIFLPWGKFPGILQTHLHSNFLKKSFEKLWDERFEILDKVCRNKFRNTFTDINQWVIKEIQVCEGSFIPQSPKIGKYHMIRSIEDAIDTSKSIKAGEAMVVCINDHCSTEVYESSYDILRKAFELKLGNKSNYEI